MCSSQENSMRIDRLRGSDAGLYTCEAENGVGRVTANVTVTIQGTHHARTIYTAACYKRYEFLSIEMLTHLVCITVRFNR